MSLLPDGDWGARAAERLRTSYVAWLTTVGADGTPQPNPVWFLWDGAEHVLVYNRPDANRLAHLAARPQVSLHLDGNGRGGDILVLAGTAARDDTQAACHENPDYLAKYRDGMLRVSGSLERFGEQYPVPVTIEIRRIRGH